MRLIRRFNKWYVTVAVLAMVVAASGAGLKWDFPGP
jgi:hypothetical protein